jgi:hypothetical protein
MGVSLIGLILVALILLPALYFGIVWIVKTFSGVRFGHVTLTCPHCAAETPANLETCQKCGKDLR